MSKHTLGPWNVIYKFGTSVGIEAGETRTYFNGEAKDQIVMMIPCAEYNGGNEATLANARLIAASPELLEALEHLLGAYERLKPSHSPVSDSEKKARAVISKAIGES